MVGAGILLLNSKNQILLILRDDKKEIPFPNMWDIPGGKVENEEGPEQTVKREMMEELGLENLGDIKLFKCIKTENIIDYIFWKRMDLNPSKIVLLEGQRIEYFNIERIRKTILAFNYNNVIEDFYNEVVSVK